MKIRLDSEKCQGHGRCYSLAPSLFDSDDEGYSVLKGDGEVADGLEREAHLAVDNCPEYAIELDA
jgi:ferredoxin